MEYLVIRDIPEPSRQKKPMRNPLFDKVELQMSTFLMNIKPYTGRIFLAAILVRSVVNSNTVTSASA
jgi:hypothetical protein